MLCLCSVTKPPFWKTTVGNLHAVFRMSAFPVMMWQFILRHATSFVWYLNAILVYLALGKVYSGREEAAIASRSLLLGVGSIQM